MEHDRRVDTMVAGGRYELYSNYAFNFRQLPRASPRRSDVLRSVDQPWVQYVLVIGAAWSCVGGPIEVHLLILSGIGLVESAEADAGGHLHQHGRVAGTLESARHPSHRGDPHRGDTRQGGRQTGEASVGTRRLRSHRDLQSVRLREGYAPRPHAMGE
jgi:hypothetical protein